MNSTPGRSKRFESVISICLLAVLVVIAVGVFIKQFDADISRFGIQHQLGVSPSSIGAGLVPYGFETLSEIEVYNSENLYEKINGKAPLYTESGFGKLLTQRFVSKDRENLWMELFIYDMSATRNAFSVYSVQRRAEAEILPGSEFGYRTSNALYLVHGKYYIELVGSSESTELFKAMTEVSQKIQANLAVDNDTKIAELVLFPTEDIIPGSIKLYLTNAFGFEGLTDTFTARYRFGDETVTAFLSRRSGPQDARTIAQAYYNFLIDNSGAAKPATNKTLEGKVVDFYGTTEIVFAIGPFVAGVHEAEDQQAAEKLAEILINKLNEIM